MLEFLRERFELFEVYVGFYLVETYDMRWNGGTYEPQAECLAED